MVKTNELAGPKNSGVLKLRGRFHLWAELGAKGGRGAGGAGIGAAPAGKVAVRPGDYPAVAVQVEGMKFAAHPNDTEPHQRAVEHLTRRVRVWRARDDGRRVSQILAPVNAHLHPTRAGKGMKKDKELSFIRGPAVDRQVQVNELLQVLVQLE